MVVYALIVLLVLVTLCLIAAVAVLLRILGGFSKFVEDLAKRR